MGPHIWTLQMNLKHRQNRHNSDWFCVIQVKLRISRARSTDSKVKETEWFKLKGAIVQH